MGRPKWGPLSVGFQKRFPLAVGAQKPCGTNTTSPDYYTGQDGGRADGISGDGNEGGCGSIEGKGEGEIEQGGGCYEVANESVYGCIDQYRDRRVYESGDKVGDGNLVALNEGNIDINSYREPVVLASRDDGPHSWGMNRDNGIESKDMNSDKDDTDNMDENENMSEDQDDNGEDGDDNEENEDDNEEDEDGNEEGEDDYPGAGERMDRNRAGAKPGHRDSYHNYCGNGCHQGNDIKIYHNGIDTSHQSGVYGTDIGMGLGDMCYGVDIPGDQDMLGGLLVEQAMVGALRNAV
ncbi:hypothetical protein C7212DRAFT_343007 [Tuber magnatum]|uniref:Uncharacterized protein n=1 Tax=Tuber magnatum TaxID=42249 RepID=A0A317STV6_9PEZI|nr:hypothetical protein C7212DRAFT_343007 [Tuber magnatum]